MRLRASFSRFRHFRRLIRSLHYSSKIYELIGNTKLWSGFGILDFLGRPPLFYHLGRGVLSLSPFRGLVHFVQKRHEIRTEPESSWDYSSLLDCFHLPSPSFVNHRVRRLLITTTAERDRRGWISSKNYKFAFSFQSFAEIRRE